MRYLKYGALLAVLLVPLAYSQAQVRVGIGIGVGPAYAGPPVCSYGYYDYYPYACAPYGYYGADYFVNGVFIGAGPWYHWGHPAWYWNRAHYYRGWDHDRFYRRGGWGRGWDHRGYAYRHESHGRAFAHDRGLRGGEFHGGGGRHGGRR